LITVSVIKLKPDETNALAIELTYVTVAASIVGFEGDVTGLRGNKLSVRYHVTAFQPGDGGEVVEQVAGRIITAGESSPYLPDDAKVCAAAVVGRTKYY
jgi:hypothetical protein